MKMIIGKLEEGKKREMSKLKLDVDKIDEILMKEKQDYMIEKAK